jgi:hypothetical protein
MHTIEVLRKKGKLIGSTEKQPLEQALLGVMHMLHVVMKDGEIVTHNGEVVCHLDNGV